MLIPGKLYKCSYLKDNHGDVRVFTGNPRILYSEEGYFIKATEPIMFIEMIKFIHCDLPQEEYVFLHKGKRIFLSPDLIFTKIDNS